VITRLAPTPSGYLHFGNAVNFQLVAWLAERQGGDVVLRIDDLDRSRYRSQYVDDILDMIAWMGIPVARGPRTRAEVEAALTLDGRGDRVRAALDTARENGLEVYACVCSRSAVRGVPVGGCPVAAGTLTCPSRPA